MDLIIFEISFMFLPLAQLKDFSDEMVVICGEGESLCRY